MAHRHKRKSTFVVVAAVLVFAVSHQATAQTADQRSCELISGDISIAACSRVIQKNSNSSNDKAYAYNLRGVNYYQQKGDYKKAISDFDESTRLSPSYVEPYFHRGVVWGILGYNDKSIVDFKEALRLDPNNTHAAANLKKMIEAKAKQGSSVTSVPVQQQQCDLLLFNANAIFVRATTFCAKNYMDSAAGFRALDGARKCTSIDYSESRVQAEMLELDKKVNSVGRIAACKWVEGLAKRIMEKGY